MACTETVIGAESVARESMKAVENITVELLNGGSLEIPSVGLRYVAQLREVVSASLRCSCHAVVLLCEDCVLEDDVCLSGMPTVSAMVNGGLEVIELLEAAARAYETVAVEASVISGRTRTSVLDDGWHVVGGSQVDAHWIIDEATTTSKVRAGIDHFKITIEALIEHCESSPLPCWNGGSCFNLCRHCGRGTSRKLDSRPDVAKKGLNKELADAYHQLQYVLSDKLAGHPQFRWRFLYGRSTELQKNDTACVPCCLRQVLPRLLSLRCDLTRWAKRNVWYLCLDDSKSPATAFDVGCVCIPRLRVPGMALPAGRRVDLDTVDFDDERDDAMSEYTYDFHDYDDYDSGNEHDPNEHSNAWRRVVRPWQRAVRAKKTMQTQESLARMRTKSDSLKHYRQAARPRGGRCKDGEQGSRLGKDRTFTARHQ